MKEKFAEELLEKTRQDYDLIAKEYSESRHRLWPELSIFKDLVKDGDRILDLGCGNGRLAELFKDKSIDYLGVDNSEGQIREARLKCPQNKFLVADALALDLPDNSFEAVFSIAVIHHIPGEENRRKFLLEAKRILKPGGFLILTVWNLFYPKTFLLTLRYLLLEMIGLSKLDFGDVFIPWGNKTRRYYHYFTKKELNKLLGAAGFKVNKVGSLVGVGGKHWRRANFYAIAQKPVSE